MSPRVRAPLYGRELSDEDDHLLGRSDPTSGPRHDGLIDVPRTPPNPFATLMQNCLVAPLEAYKAYLGSCSTFSRYPRELRDTLSQHIVDESLSDPHVLADLDRHDVDTLWAKHQDSLGYPGRTLFRALVITIHEATYPGTSRAFSPPQRHRGVSPEPGGSPGHSPDLAKAISKLARASRRPRKHIDDRGLSEDSDLEPGDYFDLGSVLRESSDAKGSATLLEPSWFGDLTRLQRLHRSRATRLNPRVPYLASTAVELWTPCWVGLGLPRSARKAVITQREKKLEGTARLINNVSCFWLSHFAIGEVSITAVFAHVLLISRIADERSSDFASKYVLLFNEHLKDRIKSSEAFDLSAAIATKDLVVWQRLELQELTHSRPSQQPNLRARGSGGARGRGGSQASRHSAPAPVSPGEPRLPFPPPLPVLRPTGPRVASGPKRPVCFDNDPRSNRSCASGAACLKEHLDTKHPDQARRFDAAKAASAARAARG